MLRHYNIIFSAFRIIAHFALKGKVDICTNIVELNVSFVYPTNIEYERNELLNRSGKVGFAVLQG